MSPDKKLHDACVGMFIQIGTESGKMCAYLPNTKSVFPHMVRVYIKMHRWASPWPREWPSPRSSGPMSINEHVDYIHQGSEAWLHAGLSLPKA